MLHCNGDLAETAALLAGCPSLSDLAEERLHAAKARVAEALRPLDPAALQAARDARSARRRRDGVTWLPELAAAVLAAVLAITLHEAAHGYAALALGDDTAKRMGRLSLNPLRHVDPVGTVLVPGVLLLGQLLTLGRVEAMFGWAKPVPVNLLALRDPAPGHDAGGGGGAGDQFRPCLDRGAARAPAGRPAANFSRAELVAWVYRFLALSILANLVLGLFNLLPIPPLDGGRILAGLLPARAGAALHAAGALRPAARDRRRARAAARWPTASTRSGWALRTVVADGFDLVLLLSFHGGRA